MTSHKKMITYLWNFSFGFFTIHNILSFLIFTSLFEIDAWNFFIFQFDEQAFGFLGIIHCHICRFPFFLVKY